MCYALAVSSGIQNFDVCHCSRAFVLFEKSNEENDGGAICSPLRSKIKIPEN